MDNIRMVLRDKIYISLVTREQIKIPMVFSLPQPANNSEDTESSTKR